MDKGIGSVRSWAPFVFVGVLVVAVILVSLPVHAQRGGGRGPRLSGEQSKAAWAVEAKYVAGTLSLSEEVSGKLAGAYEAAHTSFGAAMAKKREEMQNSGDDRSARWAAYRKAQQETTAAEREKLKKALSEFLKEEQTIKAMEKLGIFSMRLDSMVHTLAGFTLGEKEAKALEKVYAYALGEAKLFEGSSGQQGNSEELRGKMETLKKDLDAALAGILSEEQLGQWKTATARPSRGGRGTPQAGP